MTEIFGDGCHRGVGLVESGQRGIDALLSCSAKRLGALNLKPKPLERVHGALQIFRSLGDGCLDLDQALLGRRTARSEVRPDHITVTRHRDHVGRLCDQLPRLFEVVDHSHLVEQASQRALKGCRSVDDIDRIRREGRQSRPRGVVDLATAQQHAGTT